MSYVLNPARAKALALQAPPRLGLRKAPGSASVAQCLAVRVSRSGCRRGVARELACSAMVRQRSERCAGGHGGLRCWSASALRPRLFAYGATLSAGQVPRAQRCVARPNPSIKRTRNGMPPPGLISFWPGGVTPLRAA
jgi:hypothetical protein